MRILWYSNHPYTPGGYGAQTDMMTRYLVEKGHEVHLVDNTSFGSVPTYYIDENRPVHAAMGGQARDMVMSKWVVELRPDLVIGLYDPWPCDIPVWHMVSRTVPTLWWSPIDSWPLARNEPFFERTAAIPMPMSQFGHRMFTEAGFIPTDVLPHAVDPNFKRHYNADMRRFMMCGLEEGFSILMVMANTQRDFPRKGWPAALQAFKAVLDEIPDARLYMHTEMSTTYTGCNLEKFVVDMDLQDHVSAPHRFGLIDGADTKTLATIYSSADVLLAPSMGEGFCVPLIEAQACGTPIIATNATAQAELCGAGHLLDRGVDYWYEGHGSWYRHVDYTEIVERLIEVHARERKQVRNDQRAARKFVRQFTVDRVGKMLEARIAEAFDRWSPDIEPQKA